MTGLKTRKRSNDTTERFRTEPLEAAARVGGYLRITPAGMEAATYGGLCALCNLRETCAFPRSSDRPIMSCDEFDGLDRSVRLHVMEPARTPASSAEETAVATEKDRSAGVTLWGLCTTCVKRETCDFPRPDGGVWQCEEFE